MVMSYVIDFELAGIPATHTFERFTWAEAAYDGLTRNPDCRRAELIEHGVTVARHETDACRKCSGTGYLPGSISGCEPPESTERRCECNPMPRLPELSPKVRAELVELVEQMAL